MAEQIPRTIRDAQLAALDPPPGPVTASLHAGDERFAEMARCTCAYTYRMGAWRQEIDRDCALHGGTVPSGGSIRVPRMEDWPAPWRAAAMRAALAALRDVGADYRSEFAALNASWLRDLVRAALEGDS